MMALILSLLLLMGGRAYATEQIFNGCSSTLAGAITATQCSVTVANGACFAGTGSGTSTIQIDQELDTILSVTGNVLSLNCLSSNRVPELPTVAAIHANGAQVLGGMASARAMAQFKADVLGNPPATTTIPGTSIAVGAGSFATAVGACPTESTAGGGPFDPINFGADKTGATDSDLAINSALNGGDVHFGTPGTYLMNRTHSGQGFITSLGIQPPANRKIECVPGVTIKTTLQDNSFTGIFAMANGGNTVCGCDFQGANIGPTPKTLNVSANGGTALLMFGGSGYTIEDNTFENWQGDGAVQAAANPVSNVVFTYNTCSLNPLYCFVFNATMGGAANVASHNLVTDSWLGAEFDNCLNGGTIGTPITITDNMVQTQNGTCYASGQTGPCAANGGTGPGFVAVGSGSTTCNYSGVTVGPSNYVQGAGTTAALTGFIGNSIDGSVTGALSPHITGNIIGPNAVCLNGAGC